MKRKLRRKLVLLLASLSLVIPIISLAAPASAASCYHASCEGLDPGAAGCSGVTTQSTPIQDGYGNNVATLELRWSSGCGTNWARVSSYGGAYSLNAYVAHGWNFGAGNSYYEGAYTSGSLYTDMTATWAETACVQGWVSGGPSSYLCG